MKLTVLSGNTIKLRSVRLSKQFLDSKSGSLKMTMFHFQKTVRVSLSNPG